MIKMFKIREEVGLPHFSKQIYLVYWVQLVNRATLSSSIVSIKLGESVYKPIGIRDAMEYLQISESTWYRFMSECKINKSVALHQDNLYINPRFNYNVWNFNMITLEVFKEYDPLFMPFIETYGINIKEELYELLSMEDVKVKGNRVSPELYILKAKEKHKDRFEYKATMYKGMKGIIKVKCIKHNQEFEIIAENHLNSLGGCPICHKEHLAYTYYNLPTYFYVIQVGHLFKIGITTGTIKSRYAKEKVEYKVLFNMLFDFGEPAFKLEQWCKDVFKEHRYFGESPFKHTGITEVFTLDVSNHPDFIMKVNSLKDNING